MLKLQEVKPAAVKGKFTQMPKKPVCLDEGKQEYGVAELEQGVICYRADSERVRDNLRLLQRAVAERDKK